MARKKSNDLKLTEIKREAKSVNKKESVELSNGKDLHFYPVFPEKIIKNLLNELQEKMIYVAEKEIELNDADIFNYVSFLCIKYFTHLNKDIPDEFEKQIEAMGWLVDTRLFKEIVEEIFDKNELMKVWDEVGDFLAMSQFSDKIMKTVQEKIESLELENKDVIDNVFKNRNVGIKNGAIEEKLNETIQ